MNMTDSQFVVSHQTVRISSNMLSRNLYIALYFVYVDVLSILPWTVLFKNFSIYDKSSVTCAADSGDKIKQMIDFFRWKNKRVPGICFFLQSLREGSGEKTTWSMQPCWLFPQISHQSEITYRLYARETRILSLLKNVMLFHFHDNLSFFHMKYMLQFLCHSTLREKEGNR